MKWILIKDRLPEYGERILIALKSGFVTEQYFITKDYKELKTENKELFDKIVAWVPMPKYKED